MIVEYVIRLVSRNVRLEEPEAVSVNGPHEQTTELVEHASAKTILGALCNPLPKFGRRSLGEGERNDGASSDAGGQQVGHPLRHDLGLT